MCIEARGCGVRCAKHLQQNHICFCMKQKVNWEMFVLHVVIMVMFLLFVVTLGYFMLFYISSQNIPYNPVYHPKNEDVFSQVGCGLTVPTVRRELEKVVQKCLERKRFKRRGRCGKHEDNPFNSSKMSKQHLMYIKYLFVDTAGCFCDRNKVTRILAKEVGDPRRPPCCQGFLGVASSEWGRSQQGDERN